MTTPRFPSFHECRSTKILIGRAGSRHQIRTGSSLNDPKALRGSCPDPNQQSGRTCRTNTHLSEPCSSIASSRIQLNSGHQSLSLPRSSVAFHRRSSSPGSSWRKANLGRRPHPSVLKISRNLVRATTPEKSRSRLGEPSSVVSCHKPCPPSSAYAAFAKKCRCLRHPPVPVLI